jgi:hypothetical protein
MIYFSIIYLQGVEQQCEKNQGYGGEGVRIMVFNATFNNISLISWRSVYVGRKPEY